jgi:hypothetical protein
VAASAQQRQHRLGEAPGTEHVHLEHLVGLLEIGVGRPGRRAVDACVVDEDVEPARVGADVSRGMRHAFLTGDIELDHGYAAALRLDLAGLPLPGRAVA